MIKLLLDMLSSADHFGISEEVDIAKGKNQLKTDIRGIYKKVKREFYGNRKGN